MDKHLSTQFDAEISAISTRVLELGGLVESQIAQAVYALRHFDAEAARGVMITAERVIAELERHGIDDMEQTLECFDEIEAHVIDGRTLYDAGDVLDYLGY